METTLLMKCVCDRACQRLFGSGTSIDGVSGIIVADLGRRVDADPLVGAAEIADRLGASNSQVVHVWRGRHPDFPKPTKPLNTAMSSYSPGVERWVLQTGRFSKS